jgi:hypothetical protein
MQIEKRDLEDRVQYGYYQGNEFIFHREDGPAIDCENGPKSWWIHGVRHREGGPAVEYANMERDWFFYGKLHREDGPAVEWPHKREWWLEDKEIKEEDFEEAVKIYKVNKLCK